MWMSQNPTEWQGWQAGLRLGFRADARGTLLAERERHGPLAVQRPFYPEGDVCHVYVLHPPGGVVGGDSLAIEATLEEDAHALITTPGATKFYRSGGDRARQHQLIRLADGATLEWLPQENIFFPGATVDLYTRVELHGDARVALWEIQCLGRPVIDEPFEHGDIDSRLSLYRDGLPLLLDRVRVSADNRARLSLMAGRPVSATLVISGADASSVDDCRALPTDAADRIGVTLVEDLLVARYLGDSTEQARRAFGAIWRRLRPRTLGRVAAEPRIWAT